MSDLTSKQRKYLRGVAHGLDPVVHVGKEGLTDELLAQVERALDTHELIKVRFVAGKTEKAALAAEICARTGAGEAGRLGHVAILFRRQSDPERRRVRLPGE